MIARIGPIRSRRGNEAEIVRSHKTRLVTSAATSVFMENLHTHFGAHWNHEPENDWVAQAPRLSCSAPSPNTALLNDLVPVGEAPTGAAEAAALPILQIGSWALSFRFAFYLRSCLFHPLLLSLIFLAVGCREATVTISEPTKTPSAAVHGMSLDNQPTDPFASSDARAFVFVFVSTDCPISNRYAPEIRRLQSAFASKGVVFWLIYPNADETAAAIRKHQRDFSYSFGALRDPQHALVKTAKARVTPDAAVFTNERKLIYHGRIDDRYVDFGKERLEATTHDLEQALEALLAGKAIPPSAPGVGCYISEAPAR